MASTWRVCLRQTSLLYQPLVRAALLCPSHKATWLPIASAVPFRALSSSHSSDYSHQKRRNSAVSHDADQMDTLGTKALKIIARMSGFYSRKNVLCRSALWIYKNTFDDIDYEAFFRVCRLPDSMHSWFLIAHLHMWLLMVRLRREGEDGQFLTKQLVEMFWEDVKQRPRALGVHSSSLIAQSMKEWSGMFAGLIIAYEEGLLLNDKILAAAIWRNLVGDREAVDLPDLEAMVHYIRSQVKHMDSIDSDLLLRNGRIELLPCTPAPNT